MAKIELSVSQVCAWTGGRVVNSDALAGMQDAIRVGRPAPLSTAKPGELAFFFNKAYRDELPTAAPGILITGEPFVEPLAAAGLPLWKTSAVIACPDPYLAMAILSEKFAEKVSTVAHMPSEILAGVAESGGRPQIHPTAYVDPTADLGAGVQVGAGAVIEADARIGVGTVIYPGCFIGPRCVVGERCVFFPNVVLYEWTEVGNRVRIHANSTLGSDGFGYAPRFEDAPEGPRVVGHQKIHHLGRVVVGDDVEIGANSCIDRGTIADTRVDKGAKIDNHVHLGHNAHVGEGSVVCGGVCFAGNASVGKFTYIGGMSGIVNQVHVGDGGKVGALSLITRDVPPGGTAVGNPQRDHKEHFHVHSFLNRLAKASRKGSKNGEAKS